MQSKLKTRDALSAFHDLDIPVSKGNNIFMAGNAAKYLSEYYPAPALDWSETCGSRAYTEPLTNITSLSIVPNGDVMVCAFVIGNIYRDSIADIVARYNPYEDEYMQAIVTGGAARLTELATQKGLTVDTSGCYSICDVCRQINRQR